MENALSWGENVVKYGVSGKKIHSTLCQFLNFPLSSLPLSYLRKCFNAIFPCTLIRMVWNYA